MDRERQSLDSGKTLRVSGTEVEEFGAPPPPRYTRGFTYDRYRFTSEK